MPMTAKRRKKKPTVRKMAAKKPARKAAKKRPLGDEEGQEVASRGIAAVSYALLTSGILVAPGLAKASRGFPHGGRGLLFKNFLKRASCPHHCALLCLGMLPAVSTHSRIVMASAFEREGTKGSQAAP
jgi:hypothetical protein